jgi:hypothetical protein
VWGYRNVRRHKRADVYHVVVVAGLDNKNLSEQVCIVHSREYNFDEGRVFGFDPVLVHETGGFH